MNEFQSLLILAAITISLLILFEFLARKNVITKNLSRKLLHITTGFIVVYLPFVVQNFWLVVFVGIAFSISNFILIKKHLIKQINDTGTVNWGIFYYPLSFLICTLLFWNVNKFIISLSFLIFSIGDAFAALVGNYSSIKYLTRITKEPKTFNGVIAFVLSSFFLLWIVKVFLWEKLNFIDYNWLEFSFLALIFSLLGGITEAVSTKGTDNLSLPIILSSATMMFFVKGINLSSFVLAFVLAFLISIFSYKMKFLDLGGSAVTFLLAVFIFGIGGWKWTIPILTFFIFSSLLSKIAEKISKKDVSSIFEKGSQRDYKQVLANGGVPLLIIVLGNLVPLKIDWYSIYLLSIAIATADTWSTEFGTLFAKNVYLITNFRKVTPGISGGISFIGTLGGVLGSILIIFSAGFFIPLNLKIFLSIVFYALLGNLFDSLMGATIQVIYKCSICGKLTEKKFHCSKETDYHKGIKFIDNDMVNLGSVFFISLVYFLFLIV
ncbi:MAG: DUF92 domain-containing protein [Ignavibacteria bacterium]|jgi:uncharacterized protein (TIGR00297 family)|nr:DUF92 domain-containing protein [Ignavibacteria bacterium]MDH7526622.1 DUF92 domain-containing protein [Ignavibacteria bacterium]